MKIRKMLSLVAAGAITASMLSGMMVANAAAGPVGTKDVPVTYDTRSGIIDPEVPPTWFVQIPAAINFTETDKTIDASVKLLDEDKTSPYADADTIRVTVKSTNGYKLNASNVANGNVAYRLAYGNGVGELSGTNATTLGDLTKTNHSVQGIATLTGTTSKIDKFTDTLTYTAQKQ